MTNRSKEISLSTAALIAGIGYILMFGTPIAEFLVYNKLVVPGNDALTVHNISANMARFNLGIFAYLINFVGDILAAWGLYILLKPAGKNLSLLAALLRITYTIISLAVLLNLLTVVELLHRPDYLKTVGPAILQAQVMLSLHAFRNGWSFAFIFFGIYLLLLGYLVFRLGYIPKLVCICLIIAGLGWLADNLQPYLYPGVNVNVGMMTGVGELVLMVWLLVWGSRLKGTD